MEILLKNSSFGECFGNRRTESLAGVSCSHGSIAVWWSIPFLERKGGARMPFFLGKGRRGTGKYVDNKTVCTWNSTKHGNISFNESRESSVLKVCTKHSAIVEGKWGGEWWESKERASEREILAGTKNLELLSVKR